MKRTCDVVVVGARVAGSATAMLLARAGLDVVAVDRAAFPSDTRSTHSIAGHGSVLLERWGLLEAVVATGAPRGRAIGLHVGGLDAELPVADAHPGTLAPRRTVLDHLLVRAAREAGAEVREGVAVRRIEPGAVSTDAGDIVAPLIVGADGVHSRVASAFSADAYVVEPSHDSGVYAYFGDTALVSNQLGLAPRRAGLAFVTNDDLVCVAAAVPDDDLAWLLGAREDGVLEVLDVAAPRIAEGVRRGRRASRWHMFRPVAGRYHEASGPGWALVGDAGHHLDPITGQGIANAFLSAQLLANAVVDDALDEYGPRRDELTRRMHGLTGELSRFEWDGERVLGLFLDYRAESEKLLIETMSLR